MGDQVPGPTLASPDFDTNYTQFMSVDTFIETESITDGIATLTNGILSNLIGPPVTTDSSYDNWAVNKAYVDISSVISEPNMSIQYNIGGLPFASFGSSQYLTFSETANTMYSSRTQIGNLVLGSGTITNLNDPVALTDAVPKNYVDNYFVTNYYTSTGSAVTYSALQMVNAIMIPQNLQAGINTAITDTAANIVALINSIIGATATFTLVNTSTNLSSVINLIANTGVTIIPDTEPLNIFSSYTMTSYIIVTNDTIGSEAVSIYITGLSYTNSDTSNFSVNSRSISTTTYNTTITNQYTFNTQDIIINSLSGYVYTAPQLSGIIYRSGETVRIEKIESVANCISNSIYGPIDYVFTTGSIEFVIKNIAEGLGNNVILSGGNGWTVDSNSNMTIGPGYTGYFYLYIDTVAVTGTIYTIAIVPVT